MAIEENEAEEEASQDHRWQEGVFKKLGEVCCLSLCVYVCVLHKLGEVCCLWHWQG